MTRNIWRLLNDVIVPAFFVCGIAWFAYGAVAGATGYRVLRVLHAETTAKTRELAILTTKRQQLERVARQLNPRSLDPDMADEKIRSILGYASADDLVVPRDQLEEILHPSE